MRRDLPQACYFIFRISVSSALRAGKYSIYDAELLGWVPLTQRLDVIPLLPVVHFVRMELGLFNNSALPGTVE